MSAYKPMSNEMEGCYSYTITEKHLDDVTIQVVLIELGLLDDSIAGEKTEMIIKSAKGVLKVVSIKENFKCYKNRGHEDWGIELCN